MSDTANNGVENPENQSKSLNSSEPQMIENTPNHVACDPSGEKETAHIENNDIYILGDKSVEIEDDDDEDIEEPEIIIDSIVNPLEVDDDASSETSLIAVKLTRSAANESMRQECLTESNNVSKSTEFVIVSTISQSTVKFPDDVQIKDELTEPIATACPPDDEDVLENDPMGLLEINDRSDVNSTRSNVEPDDVADDISSTCSSSIKTTVSTVNISDWAKDYPWLLHEECDEWYGYCLYCDVKLSVRSHKSAKHHGMSLYHQERCAHYLAFREEEEKNNLGTSVAEIKQEFGTDSYVAALKLKRKTQAEAFNNYNWRRWLEECSWLERDSSAGTIGLCKYCSVRLNVEFTYLRQRHQESGQHKDRAKQYATLNESKSDEVIAANEENEGDEVEAATSDSPEAQADADADDDEDENEQETSKSDDNWCFDNKTGRCTLCDIVLKKKNSYKRHVQSQFHIHQERCHLLAAQQKSKNGKDSSLQDDSDPTLSKTPINSWQIYAQLHSWLTADPLDSSFAYCKYCKKRLLYGSSAAKRATHENSYSHKAQEKTYKDSQEKGDNKDAAQANEEDESAVDGGDEDGDNEEEAEVNAAANEQEEEEKESEHEDEASAEEEGEDEQEDDADEEDENSEEEEEKEDEEDEKDDDDEEEEEANDQETNADEEESGAGDAIKSKKRPISTNAQEWFNQFPWCKRYRKDPKYCFCSYCKIPITKANRRKHGNSKKHFEAEEKILKRKNRSETKKGAKEEDLFEWAVDIKAQPSLYYCKFCRVRISKHYSKKQHSISKIHQINEKLYQNRKNTVNPENKTTPPATPSPQPRQQRSEAPVLRKVVVKGQSFITSIKQWQKRHSWLGYKLSELRSNYAYCKACEQSLFVRSFKNVIKHQRSSKHMRTVNQLKRDRQKETNASVDKKTTKQEVDQNASAPAEDTSMQQENSGELNTSTIDSAKGNSYKSTIDTMQKRYSWITKSSKREHAYCRYCDEDVPLKIIFLRNHTNSRAHRRSVVNFGATKTKTEKKQQDESNAAGNEAEGDDDEAGDDVVLLEDNAEEILISEQDDNWTVKSENMDEHEALDCLLQLAGKSGQSSHNANASRDDRKQATITDERPSKRVKRSHSFRRLNDSTNSSILSSILQTPLTLASCLGPLIQQQIQQATNLQQSSASPSTTATSVASQPPLPRAIEPENTYDLFFKSISETMKKMPADIAAEGRVKVMQIICDLELKAIKRNQEQELTLAREQSAEQSNNSIFTSTHIANASNSNVMVTSPTVENVTNSNVITNSPTTLNLTNFTSNEQGSETNGNTSRVTTENNPTTSVPDQYMGETLITPIYGNVNTTSTTTRKSYQQQYQQQIQQKPQQTSVSNLNKSSYTAASSSATTSVTVDKNKSPNQAPIIGVMDMNGLQTLQLRNNPIVKQIPKQNLAANTGQPTATTTSIRCIPFKNLTQNTSGDTNTKITHIQVPISATSTPTSQTSQNNTSSLTNATKGLLNLRSIHITKRTGTTPQQHQQPQISSPVSVSMVNTITDKNQPTTYVQSPNMQRWTPVNGSVNTIPHKKAQQQCTTTTANFQVSTKQHNYTQVNRNYK